MENSHHPLAVVAAVIEDMHGRILLQRRPKSASWLSERWELPGGKIEDKESLEEALHREMWEELGSKIVIKRLVHSAMNYWPDGHINLVTFYHVTLENQPTKSVGTLVWFERDDIASCDPLLGCEDAISKIDYE